MEILGTIKKMGDGKFKPTINVAENGIIVEGYEFNESFVDPNEAINFLNKVLKEEIIPAFEEAFGKATVSPMLKCHDPNCDCKKRKENLH